MLILGVNRILQWVQIANGGRRYTCPMKEIDGEAFFRFKNEWHKVMDFITDHTTELVSEGGRVFRKQQRNRKVINRKKRWSANAQNPPASLSVVA